MSVISLADQAFASSLPPLYAPAFTATSINLDETAPTGEIAQLRASIPAPGYAGITMNGYLQIKQATLALTDPSSQLLVNLPSDPGAANSFQNPITCPLIQVSAPAVAPDQGTLRFTANDASGHYYSTFIANGTTPSFQNGSLSLFAYKNGVNPINQVWNIQPATDAPGSQATLNLTAPTTINPAVVSATPNGFVQYGSILFQWGYVSPGTPGTVSFNTPFSSNPYTIQLTAASAAASVIQVASSTATGFTFINSTTQPFYWFAVGAA